MDRGIHDDICFDLRGGHCQRRPLQILRDVPYHQTDTILCKERYFQVNWFQHANRLFRNEDGSIKQNDSVIFAISHDNRGAEDIPFVNKENGENRG